MIEEEILTIDEVSKYLRVSERTVYDWAQKGEIPAGKIGTVWRFRRSEIEQWVNSRFTSQQKTGYTAIQIESIISQERILLLNHTAKQDALTALAENLATAPQVKNRQELVEKIIRREDLMSTAMGGGIAIPHVRLSSVTDLVVSVGISSVPITGFQPLDDEPVRLLFMIAAGYNQHAYYLQTLSFFSARLKNKELRSSLLGIKTTEEAYKLLVRSGF